MIVLKETTESQTIPCIVYADGFTLTCEDTNTSVDIDATFTENSYYYQGDAVLDLVEGRYYRIDFTLSGETVLSDKVFCTNQSISTYSINNNVYVENTTSNEYTIFDE